jgi:hypothetical protein
MERDMKAKLLLAAMTFAGMASVPVQATTLYSFDNVYIGSVDTIYGWICNTASPYSNPGGSIAVYSGGPPGGGGTLYDTYPLSINWGFASAGSAASCGGNGNAGFQLNLWLPGPFIYLYWKTPANVLYYIDGSPVDCTGDGPGWCQ